MSLEELTLYDLMGEGHYVHLRKSNGFGYDMEVIREDTDETFTENEVHPCAVEGLAEFCRMYLNQYQRVCES